ncbi:hypothetical protein KQX54_002777 [Cotesia glomerata]|uniref:Nucleolar pre-ribosomal-associated protein 1 n=2 Tax=Cotesia glomerata TaxID=32391 RepID=A0AAV7ISH7_COTGL|nr:hypothetical protein KQX54_002777 [Cotesia glomerata]
MTKIVEEDNKVNKLSENFENQGDNCDKKIKKLKNKKNEGSKKKKRKLENVENFENQPEVKKNKENLEVNHDQELMETSDPSPPKDPNTEPFSDPEDTEEPEALTSEDQQLTVKYFRNSFTSPNAFGALRKFVALGSTSPAQILADYLDSGGNVMEILRLLDGLDKKRLNDVALVFNASALVIMRTIATHPQQQPSTIQACRFILNTHISLLRSLMSKSVFPRQRKSALKLLTSMVMLGDSLPRNILTHLTFDRETISLLAKQTKPSDPESVRVCFINFLLAFLIDTEPWTVRCLVDKSELLASIFPELTYDRANLVHLVLNVLKKYLLENPAVSKTQKHHLFSVQVIESIVQLYNYRGPRSWSDSRRKNQGPTDPLVNDKETVVSATHEFLLTLLTSAKHGIIFRDQNLGTRKDHNSRVARVIQNLDKPWNHPRPRELVTRILGSCPDLVKLVLGTSEPFFEPRPNKNWINLVSFYRDILEFSLDSIRNTLVTLSVQQCVSVTLTLAAPASVLRAIGPSVGSEHLVVRFQGLLTLGAMLSKVRRFFAVIDDHFSEQDAESYRVSIQNYLAKHLPKVAEVLRAWNELRNSLGESLDQEFLPQEPTEYLDAVLSLLENYRECNQEPGGRLDFDFDAENPNLGTKVRVIEVNYWLDPKAYEVKEKLFSSSLTFLVESLEGSENLVGTLKTVLGPLKPFQECPEHLDIWIQALRWISKDKRAGLAKWVVNLLRKMSKCPEKFANVLKDVEKALKREKELQLVPMVFVAAVSSLKESFDETVNVFLGYVTILTLHSLRDPRILAKLVENTDLMTKYLKGWLDGEVRKLKDFPCELMSSVSKYLLSKKDISLETLESLEVCTEIQKENLFYMILFYFTNLVKANQETGARKCKVALLWILKLMKSSEDVPEGNTKVQKRFRMFAKLFAEHPVVLKNFSFIVTENFAETFISKECFDIFKLIPDLDFYKDKVLSDLSKAIDEKFTDKIIDKIEYFDIFEISGKEISELLSGILELKSSKFYQNELTTLGRLVSKLLEILAIKTLDFEYTDLVMKFWRHLGKLKAKKIDTSAWESAILMFLDGDEVVIDKQQFKMILTDLRVSTIALMNLLVKQNPALVAPLSQFLLTQHKNPEILFPLMQPNLEKLKPQLLTTIFENYAPEILEYFDEVTNPWIEQFPLAAQFLISKKFTKEQCQQVADKLLESREKLERINSSYLALVSVVWEKRAEFESPIETVEEYLQILLPIAVSALKKAKKDGERLDAVTSCMVKALDKLEKLKPEGYLFEKVVRNNAFKQLVNYSLKHGLKVDVPSSSLSKDKVMPSLDSLEALLKLDEVKETPVESFSILDVLSKLLNVAYSNSTSDNYAEQIYDMMRTNSNFEEVILSKSTTKVSLLRLFLTMTRKVPGKIESEDLKLLMRAYEATLNPGDQLILMILQFYESRGLYLETGLLWGRGATNHTGGDVDTNLWRQITASQTLELLDPEIVARTVKFYPIDRGLRSTEVLEFESEIYDPAFYLPLMVTLSTADKLLPTNKLVKSGAMALVLSSCASNHSDVRLAAFTALSQFYYHFDAAKNKDKMIWLRCIDALRNGVAQLIGPEAKLETLRLSSLITTFLARTSLISAKDGNVMFAPIQGYFMAKQALDLKVVPEFLTLFHSSDVNHKSYRHWMLECVRDGIKSYYDVKLALKMSIFKMIMDFYGSVLADQDTKALILQIIEATVKIPRSSIILIKEYSLFNWLHELAPKIDQRNRQVVGTLINILKHLSKSRLGTTDKALKDHAEFMIQMIIKASN